MVAALGKNQTLISRSFTVYLPSAMCRERIQGLIYKTSREFS